MFMPIKSSPSIQRGPLGSPSPGPSFTSEAGPVVGQQPLLSLREPSALRQEGPAPLPGAFLARNRVSNYSGLSTPSLFCVMRVEEGAGDSSLARRCPQGLIPFISLLVVARGLPTHLPSRPLQKAIVITLALLVVRKAKISRIPHRLSLISRDCSQITLSC